MNLIPEVDPDVEHRMRDINTATEAFASNLGAAEYLAATEIAEDVGIEMEFMARLQKISSAQWQLWFEDNQQTLQTLREERSILGWLSTTLDHMSRRAQHQQEGWLAFLQSLSVEQQKRIETHQQLTRPLFEFFATDLRAKKTGGD